MYIRTILSRIQRKDNGNECVGKSAKPCSTYLQFVACLAWKFFNIHGHCIFCKTRIEFPVLSVLILLSIGIFAVGAGLISGFFSVNESKNIVTFASRIHGASAAIGFMALLFFPLLNGILSLKQEEMAFGIVNIVSFILALICFVCFVLGDKEQFENTVLRYEGSWERMTLFCMYIPFLCKSIYGLVF